MQQRREWVLRIITFLLFMAIFFFGFCAGKASGAAEQPQEEPVAKVIRALVEAGAACDGPTDQSYLQTAGIKHLAGIDTEAVMELPELPQEPELESLGTWKITAYCACKKCCGKSPDDPRYGITATGTVATEGRTIAADPRVIPYGTVVYIDGHAYTVEDCGGAIKNERIDIYFDSHEATLQWGVQYWEVFKCTKEQ